jgi:hypothetical protein
MFMSGGPDVLISMTSSRVVGIPSEADPGCNRGGGYVGDTMAEKESSSPIVR